MTSFRTNTNFGPGRASTSVKYACLHVYVEHTNRGPVCAIHQRLDIRASLLIGFILSLFISVYMRLQFLGVWYVYVGKIANSAFSCQVSQIYGKPTTYLKLHSLSECSLSHLWCREKFNFVQKYM